ncbi:MAG: DNA primase [Gammaproteobacteria bacterium]|nr:DNA primase [Gammaproteobacteria bacterium]MDH4253226.1 DNA primase [Gammaproteobacteria bacterium]MDH5308995.1 DNA primase [Gammaproteobacteria bacterium]
MTGRIPQHFIDDLVARADIVEVLGRRIQLRKAGREFKALCPFHDEKTPSFTVSPGKGFYHCFGCGAHGTTLGFLMDYDHMSFVEAVEALAQMMGLEVPQEEGQRPARRYDELFEMLDKAERWFQARLKDDERAVEYLKSRGIDGATARRFGIGYAPDGWSGILDRFGTSNEQIERLLATGLIIRKDNGQHYDRFRDRIMFPIRDSRGRCIGFGGRVLGGGEPKYLNSPETVLFHKGRELYGLYEARQALRSIERLVVVEGYMDVVGLARHGIDYAVATLGTATTEDHLNRLFRLTENVFFCFDGDRAGRAAAWRALENALPMIREGRQIRFVFLPEKQDPDSFVRERGAPEFEAAVEGGMPLSDFLIEELASRVDHDSVDGRARLAELARPLVARIPPGVYRELLMQKLAEAIGLSAPKLAALLSDATAAPKGPAAAGRAASRPARARAIHGRKPSVVRRALTLIMNFPKAGADLHVEDLAGVDRPGVDLLRDIIETVRAEPNITTAVLLERWRKDPQGRHLGKLVAAELPDDEEFDPAAELAQCISQLAQAGLHDRIEILIEKERLGSLSADEKAELRNLSRRPAGGGIL